MTIKKDIHFNSIPCVIGKKPINYDELLTRIIEGKMYTKMELMEAVKASKNWQLCSCGTLCELIPRRKWGDESSLPISLYECDPREPGSLGPVDEKLHSMGNNFYHKMNNVYQRVMSGNIEANIIRSAYQARDLHHQIEARAQVVLNETVTDEQWIDYVNKHNHDKEES